MRRFSVGSAASLASAGLLSVSLLSAAGGMASASSATPTARAAAAVNAAMVVPHWKAPGAPIDMAKLRGKKVWVLTSTLAVPFVADIVKGVEQAAKVAGWHLVVIDGQGDVTKWNTSLAEAVSEHAAAIISVAASPVVMKTEMKKAKAAHIPLIDVLTAGQASPLVPGTYAHVSISFYHSGQLQADYVIAHSNGKADVLIFGDNEFPGEVTRVQGMEQQFHALCPGCHVTFQDTQVGSLATQLPNLTQSLLRRDPKIQWVLPSYDAQALYIAPAIKQMGLAKTVHIVGSDAVPSNLAWVASNNVQIADVGEPDVWTGWAAVDEIARAMLHLKPVNPNIPLRMFTSQNLKGVSASNENALFGGSFRANYLKLWGLH